MIEGYYNEYGYRIESDGEEIYQAGNCPLESTTIVDPRYGLTLETIEEFCKQTCHEFAEERKEPLGNVEYEAEDEDTTTNGII